MDTAERLLRVARRHLTHHLHFWGEKNCATCDFIREVDAHLSSSESKESAMRPATMAGDRWPGDPLPPAPTVPPIEPWLNGIIWMCERGDYPPIAWSLKAARLAIERSSLLAQREERIKTLEDKLFRLEGAYKNSTEWIAAEAAERNQFSSPESKEGR